MLTDAQRRFLDRARVAHLATADRDGAPHLVPVCFCLDGNSLYITIDEKPKRTDVPLKRIRNIQENPSVAVTVDRWDEDGRASPGSCCAGQPRFSQAARSTTAPRTNFAGVTRNTEP